VVRSSTRCVYQGMTLLDGGLLNPVPIAPTFRDFTDLTIAVNLNAQAPRGTKPNLPAETDKQERGADRSYQARIRQFLDSIGDSLGAGGPQKLGVLELTTRCFETMQNAIADVKLAAYRPDVLIDVPRDACSSYEFHRAREMIELGHRLAEAAMGGRGS
jgi:NTE family protein